MNQLNSFHELLTDSNSYWSSSHRQEIHSGLHSSFRR